MPDTYNKITDPYLAVDQPGSVSDKTLLDWFRLNSAALLALVEQGHVPTLDLAENHAVVDWAAAGKPAVSGSVLTLCTGWNPTGAALLVNEAARAIPTGEETFDLAAPPALAASSGSIFIDFPSSNVAGDDFRFRLRATPAMLKAVILSDSAPAGGGSYNLKVYGIPVQGQSVPADPAGFVTISETELVNPLLSDLFLKKFRNRDDYLHLAQQAEHDADGVHKMGLAQLSASRILVRQSITADPAGSTRQAFVVPWGYSGASFPYGGRTQTLDFLEVFSNAAGDTGLDFFFGFRATGPTTFERVLIAQLVPGGTTTTVYEVSVWALACGVL